MWLLGSQIMIAWLFASALMFALWVVQRKTGNAAIVDFGWTAAVGIVSVFFAVSSEGFLPRRVLVAVLLGVWSMRLAAYILFDRVVGKPEDRRYRALRAQWGSAAEKKLLILFQLQAMFAVFFAFPALVDARNPVAIWTRWDIFGMIVWVFGVGNTILADWQLARFKHRLNTRGKTCREGWWRYSRHPNYFFEWLHWWTYVFLAVGSDYWWLTLLAPATMLYLLLRVTGIPPAEAQALASRGDDYRRYQRTTSAFVPWWPTRESEAHGRD